MTPNKLPPLPEPVYLAKLSKDGEWAELVPANDWTVEMWAYGTDDVYTRDQMHAYGELCRASLAGLDMGRELNQADALCRRLTRELDSAKSELRDVWAAMPKHELFLDPPGGGDVSLAAQVKRLGESHEELMLYAGRYQWLRAQPVEGGFGLPRIAVATSDQSGFFVNLEDADEVVDAARGEILPFCPVCGGRDVDHSECEAYPND